MEQKSKELIRIVYKAPGHEAKVMHVEAKYRCNLKKLVANADIIESVSIWPSPVEGTPINICVDEDGYPKGLPFNFYASINSTYFPIQRIVGVVVFTKFKPFNPYEDDYDIQLDSLSEDEIQVVLDLLSEKNQTVFENAFKNMYPDMKSYLTPVIQEIK